jgi:hypothetical protein
MLEDPLIHLHNNVNRALLGDGAGKIARPCGSQDASGKRKDNVQWHKRLSVPFYDSSRRAAPETSGDT